MMMMGDVMMMGVMWWVLHERLTQWMVYVIVMIAMVTVMQWFLLDVFMVEIALAHRLPRMASHP